MKLETLTRGQCQLVREWRNAEPQFLRTPYLITEKMQDDFYDNVINDRDSKHRYFAIAEERPDSEWVGESKFIGMGGLTNIEWENGCAEISLIIAPEYRGQGKGKEAVDLILHEAFDQMRLYSVYGEVYDCGNKEFWYKMIDCYKGFRVDLPNRKFYNGKMINSMWFSFHYSIIDSRNKQ